VGDSLVAFGYKFTDLRIYGSTPLPPAPRPATRGRETPIRESSWCRVFVNVLFVHCGHFGFRIRVNLNHTIIYQREDLNNNISKICKNGSESKRSGLAERTRCWNVKSTVSNLE